MKSHSIFTRVLATAVCLGAAAFVLGRPTRSSAPLDISHNGVHAPDNVRNKNRELMFYNFRAVEPNVLYRGSSFVRNKWLDKEQKLVPTAFTDGQAFEFLRAKRIHRVIKLQALADFKRPEEYYAEAGYFDYWSKKTGYKIVVTPMWVRAGHAYDLDNSSLNKYPLDEQRTGLRAATEFIEMMKAHKKQDGAIYLHCDAGKDRTGVVVAAYELWRNKGTMPADTLWQQVKERYVVSDTIISRDPEAAKFAGDKGTCKDGSQGFVCADWLDKLRPQLETIAQL